MSTLGNFIYAKTKDLFEEQLNAGNVLDEAVVFIENTKQIWNHGTYFDCSVASEIFEEYKNSTKQSIDGKVDKVSGKQLSTEDFTTELKTKLNGVNTYKHYYTALSSMDFNQEAWFSVANIQDTESSIIQISTNGHTDVQLAVTTGWESPDDIQKQGGSLTVLNSFMGGANEYFAYIKGIRLRKEDRQAKIEVLVNKPSSNDANKVSIVVSILTNAGHNPLVINNTQTTALQYVGTVDENTIVQSFNLEDKAIISKNLIAENIKLNGYSLEDISKQMHCLQSDPNVDFNASGNDCNCYGYVGTLQNMNISEKSVIIDSISAYVREGVASPNLGTSVWCRLLRYTNNAWEIVYQSTKSKTIKGVLPETLFTFNVEKVSDDYIINNTDRIAVTYVDSETADVLSGVQLGFKTVDKQGGLLNILTNTSAGMNWSPALVFNYLPLSKAAISGSYEDLSDKPTIPAAVTASTISGWGFTKNTGTYSKPNDGIPKTDLESSIQNKLEYVDTMYNWGNHAEVGYAKLSDIPNMDNYVIPEATFNIGMCNDNHLSKITTSGIYVGILVQGTYVIYDNALFKYTGRNTLLGEGFVYFMGNSEYENLCIFASDFPSINSGVQSVGLFNEYDHTMIKEIPVTDIIYGGTETSGPLIIEQFSLKVIDNSKYYNELSIQPSCIQIYSGISSKNESILKKRIGIKREDNDYYLFEDWFNINEGDNITSLLKEHDLSYLYTNNMLNYNKSYIIEYDNLSDLSNLHSKIQSYLESEFSDEILRVCININKYGYYSGIFCDCDVYSSTKSAYYKFIISSDFNTVQVYSTQMTEL